MKVIVKLDASVSPDLCRVVRDSVLTAKAIFTQTRFHCSSISHLTVSRAADPHLVGLLRSVHVHTHAHGADLVVKSHPSQTKDKEAGCSYSNQENGKMIGQVLDLLRGTV